MKQKRTPKGGQNPEMTIMTIYIPTKYKKLMQKLVKLGIYPSVSETIRAMMGEWLSAKLKNIDTIDKLIEQADNILEYNKEARTIHNRDLYDEKKIGGKYKPKIVIETSFVDEKIVEMEDGEKFKIRKLEKLDNESWLDKNLGKEGFIRVPKIVDSKFINEDYED